MKGAAGPWGEFPPEPAAVRAAGGGPAAEDGPVTGEPPRPGGRRPPAFERTPPWISS
ncbi:hypothetical protein Aros01_08108 [Streptosporangium roseum]